MKKALEKYVAYLILGGFVTFGAGIIFLIIEQSLNNCLPIEFTLVLVGLALVILGLLAAKIFGDLPDGRH